MITFLPYPDPIKSAEVLDKARLNKQIIEAKWMIDAIESNNVRVLKHPAVRCYIPYLDWLKFYYNSFIKVALDRGLNISNQLLDHEDPKIPWFIGNEFYHKAMKSRLFAKDSEKYKIFGGVRNYNQGQYWYPINEDKNFYRADTKLIMLKNFMRIEDLEIDKVYYLEDDYKHSFTKIIYIGSSEFLRMDCQMRVKFHQFDPHNPILFIEEESQRLFYIFKNSENNFFKGFRQS